MYIHMYYNSGEKQRARMHVYIDFVVDYILFHFVCDF